MKNEHKWIPCTPFEAHQAWVTGIRAIEVEHWRSPGQLRPVLGVFRDNGRFQYRVRAA